jgi:hypothetical protein
MRWAVLMGALAIALAFIIPTTISLFDFGAGVEARFIERVGKIPGTNEPVTADNLARWVEQNPQQAKRYAFPVLFPFDFAFLICLGLFTALASNALVSDVNWPSWLRFLPAWTAFIAPFVYIVSDGLEDVLAIGFFSSAALIGNFSFHVLSMATAIKLASVSVALAQTISLAALSLLFR